MLAAMKRHLQSTKNLRDGGFSSSLKASNLIHLEIKAIIIMRLHSLIYKGLLTENKGKLKD